MDEEILTQLFFEWLEENEDNLEVNIIYENTQGAKLSLVVEDETVVVDFGNYTVSSPSSSKLIKSWIYWSQTYFETAKSEPPQAILSSIFEKLEEFNEFGSDQNESSSNEDSDVDYRSEILDSIAPAEKVRKPLDEIAGLCQDHFIFKHAQEASQLLQRTFSSEPGMLYSCRIDSLPQSCSIRIELDLSFMSVSDDVVSMLGLTFESPLVIRIDVNELIIIQTLDRSNWTKSMLGSLSFQTTQNAAEESYGCREYIPGRIEKFKKEIYQKLGEQEEVPSLTALSRENSEEVGPPQKLDKNELRKLHEMGFSQNQAKQALLKTRNNPDAAAELLLNGKLEFKNPSKAIECNNVFYNLLFYLRDRIENCTNYCYICYERHPYDSIRLMPCTKDICQFRFEEISGVSLFTEINCNSELVFLELSLASEALGSQRAATVFEPFPSFFLKQRQIRGKSGFLSDKSSYNPSMDKNKDIKTLIEVVRSLPSPAMIKENCYNEETVKSYLESFYPSSENLPYKLMRYIIGTSRLALTKLEGADKIPQIDSQFIQYIVTKHSPETEKYFNSAKRKFGSFFAFHGSAIHNWYSILRNGIRNLSNTHMMTAGAAHGAGVYCASNSTTSLGYCQFGSSHSVWPLSMMGSSNPMGCLAIVEIIKDKNYNKNNGIIVVNNDKKLCVRYLLFFNSSGCSMNYEVNNLNLKQHMDTFLKKFHSKREAVQKIRQKKAIENAMKREQETKKAQEEKKAEQEALKLEKELEETFSGGGSAVTNKRLMQEYKNLMTSKECKGFSVEFQGSNMYVWNVKLDITQFEFPKDLKKDFENYSANFNRNQELVFELRFDSNYPYNPPFLRVVRPRFKFRTGHITVGGSICMQSLTPSGWIPVRTIESIFIELMFNMAEGGARLELTTANLDYTMQEAKEAFDRVARQHGWI